MRAYSRDLRERIVAALVAHEESHAEIAERFAVSLPFVEKLWQRWRRTGSCAAQPHGGGRRRSLRDAEGLIRAELARQPAMTLAALCERVAQAGHPHVTTKTMCLELQRLQLPLKKIASGRWARHSAGARLAHRV
jgi:transposase